VGFPSESPLKWEGPEIVARKNGYNLIMAKIMLNFEESTAERGNIYLSGRGYLGRFQYLIGIDKSSRDVFFHIWDKKERASYGPPEVGSYIKERGRIHQKDYLRSQGEKYLILGIEWGLMDRNSLRLKKVRRICQNPCKSPLQKLEMKSLRTPGIFTSTGCLNLQLELT